MVGDPNEDVVVEVRVPVVAHEVLLDEVVEDLLTAGVAPAHTHL